MRGAAATLADLAQLTKPRITAMVLFSAAGGLFLAPAAVPAATVGFLLVGTALVVASANVLNMYLERDLDARMERTRHRPLPAGRLRPEVALWFGAALGLLSLPFLSLGVNLVTGLLGLVSFVLYVAVYTPMKQRSPVALVIGAVPGAMPPLMGWTAATGRLELPGLLLFAILFFWQLPHFLAITLYRTEELSRAGYKVTAQRRGAFAAKVRIVLYLAALYPVSLLLYPLGLAGPLYLFTAVLAGAAFFAVGLYGLRAAAGPRWARALFLVSLVYLTVLMMSLIAGRLWSA
jgi:protoheme IX farnesyltransferase